MTFAYDRITGLPHRPDKENHRAIEEGGDPNFHWGNLYDQNEDVSGELIDPATGEKIDNSTYTGMESLGEVAIKDSDVSDVLGPVPRSNKDRDADEWMKGNGLSWEE